MREAVGGAALWLAVQAVAAAVGFLTVEPNEPCAALLGNMLVILPVAYGGVGLQHRRNTVIAGAGIHLCGCGILADLHLDRF